MSVLAVVTNAALIPAFRDKYGTLICCLLLFKAGSRWLAAHLEGDLVSSSRAVESSKMVSTTISLHL
jgi:hypothetical protein